MKKYLYLALTFITSILLISVVKAAGPYYLDFETPGINNGYFSDTTNVAFSNDRYITSDIIEDKGLVVTIYDKKGKALKEKVFPDTYDIDYIETLDNNIYMLIDDFGNEKYYLVKYNEELVEQKKIEQNYGIDMFNIYTKPLRIVDNKVVVIFANGIVVVDKDLTNPKSYPASDENIKKYAPDLLLTLEISSNTNNVYVFDYKDGYYAIGLAEFKDSCNVSTPTNDPATQQHGMAVTGNFDLFFDRPECYKGKLLLYDNKMNKVFEKDLKAGSFIRELRLINNHIVSIVGTEEEDSILIYDLQGNLIQTINEDTAFEELEPTPRGFIVSQFSKVCSTDFPGEPVDPVNPTEPVYPSQSVSGLEPCMANHQVYYLFREIIPKVVSGKGKINVISQQIPGEPVEFEIIPEDGYVLGEVKVTDALGNVIIIKDYKFTMPSADVTIEVTFVKANNIVPNAETTDIAITVITLLAIITGGFTISFMRRLKFLR